MRPLIDSLLQRLRSRRPWLRRRVGATVLLAIVLPANGCGMSGTNAGGYFAGPGAVRMFDAADRGDAVYLSGATVNGGQFALDATHGKVTVVNVWWSGCGPCAEEAPILASAYAQVGSSTNFVGVATRETSIANARAFATKNNITYPSIYSPSGKELLGFPPDRMPAALPTTTILDTKNRVAAMILGQLPSTTELLEVIQCVADDDVSACVAK